MRKVGALAFSHCEQLKTVQLNEGLEKLGAKETSEGEECEEGVFECSAIESVRLPSTLRRLEDQTFRSCKRLRSVEVPNGVECIGRACFQHSGVREITLPATLKCIERDALNRYGLRTVWVERGCAVDVGQHVGKSAEVRYK